MRHPQFIEDLTKAGEINKKNNEISLAARNEKTFKMRITLAYLGTL